MSSARPQTESAASRSDYDRILALIPEGARVLDLGCGNGRLLQRLTLEKHVDGCGIELEEENVIRCVEQGLSVYQGDADEGLSEYPDHAFDFVILNQTLQVLGRPREVLHEILRVGRYAVVGFPNFGHWSVRLSLLLRGRMPKVSGLPHEWYETPNVHLCTVLDFVDLCRRDDIVVLHEEYLFGERWKPLSDGGGRANLLARSGLFVISRR